MKFDLLGKTQVLVYIILGIRFKFYIIFIIMCIKRLDGIWMRLDENCLPFPWFLQTFIFFFAADVNFLTSLHVMDYSLLLGVHNVDLAAEEEANRLANPGWLKFKFGILLPKLFWPTVRKNCSSDQEFFLKAKNLQKFWDH